MTKDQSGHYEKGCKLESCYSKVLYKLLQLFH